MALYNILLASFSGIMYAFKLVHGKGLMTISQKFWMKALEKRNNHDVAWWTPSLLYLSSEQHCQSIFSTTSLSRRNPALRSYAGPSHLNLIFCKKGARSRYKGHWLVLATLAIPASSQPVILPTPKKRLEVQSFKDCMSPQDDNNFLKEYCWPC